MIKTLPAMRETQVRSLGRKDPLEKEMETHSSVLTWEIPWTEESGRLQFIGLHNWATNTFALFFQIYAHYESIPTFIEIDRRES